MSEHQYQPEVQPEVDEAMQDETEVEGEKYDGGPIPRSAESSEEEN